MININPFRRFGSTNAKLEKAPAQIARTNFKGASLESATLPDHRDSAAPQANAASPAEKTQAPKERSFASSIWGLAKGCWHIWQKGCELLPKPWNTIVKYAGPVAAATVGAVFYNTIATNAILAIQLFGGMLKPIGLSAAFLVPMVSAKPLFEKIQKFTGWDPSPFMKQVIIRGFQATMLVGAAIFVQTIELGLLTWAMWAGAACAVGYVGNKLLKNKRAAIFTATGAAALLPLLDWATIRNYDVTIKSAAPDPEVGAWNIGTDLSVKDHWMKILWPFWKQSPPSGKNGMVLLVKDEALLIPPHRSANSFYSEFQGLVGKQIRVGTIHGWAKMLGNNFQPNVINFSQQNVSPSVSATQVLPVEPLTPSITNAPAAVVSTQKLDFQNFSFGSSNTTFRAGATNALKAQ